MTTTVRICRLCGAFALLEPHEHRRDDPWACNGCVGVLLGGPWIPEWVVRLVRRLRAVS